MTDRVCSCVDECSGDPYSGWCKGLPTHASREFLFGPFGEKSAAEEAADVIPNSAASGHMDDPSAEWKAHATRNRVLTEHAYAIRHLLAHYYGPVPYEQAADIAISRLAEAMGDE